MKVNRSVKIAVDLGIVSLGTVLVSHLALTDIYRDKGDLRLEWNVLRICFAVIVAFQIAGYFMGFLVFVILIPTVIYAISQVASHQFHIPIFVLNAAK